MKCTAIAKDIFLTCSNMHDDNRAGILPLDTRTEYTGIIENTIMPNPALIDESTPYLESFYKEVTNFLKNGKHGLAEVIQDTLASLGLDEVTCLNMCDYSVDVQNNAPKSAGVIADRDYSLLFSGDRLFTVNELTEMIKSETEMKITTKYTVKL